MASGAWETLVGRTVVGLAIWLIVASRESGNTAWPTSARWKFAPLWGLWRGAGDGTDGRRPINHIADPVMKE